MSDTTTHGWEEVAARLPLDWNHYPADAQEGWEMLTRAYARYLAALAKLEAARPSEEAIRWAEIVAAESPDGMERSAARELLRIHEATRA